VVFLLQAFSLKFVYISSAPHLCNTCSCFIYVNPSN